MGERINRGDDENLYQPKIHNKRIRSLYQISEDKNLPMTILVDLAIKEYLENYEVQDREAIFSESYDLRDRGGKLESD